MFSGFGRSTSRGEADQLRGLAVHVRDGFLAYRQINVDIVKS